MLRLRSFLHILLIACWITAVAVASAALLRYAGAAGTSGPVPLSWPSASALPPPQRQPVVVQFLHPHCPCSRASVGNLARIGARLGPRARIEVLLVAPPGVEESWVAGALYDVVRSDPGMRVHIDRDGREARLFGAMTSGQSYLFDARGRCLFAGGITPLRGHEGGNPGMDAVISQVLLGTSEVATWAVTGCPLFDRPDGAVAPASERNDE